MRAAGQAFRKRDARDGLRCERYDSPDGVLRLYENHVLSARRTGPLPASVCQLLRRAVGEALFGTPFFPQTCPNDIFSPPLVR